MIEPVPKIEPLVNDLKSLRMGDFLKTNEFRRYCIKVGLEDFWRNTFNFAKMQRGYFAPDIDHDYFDSLVALTIIMNHFFDNAHKDFFRLVNGLLENYTEWSKEDLPNKDLLEDLKLLSAPNEIIKSIENLGYRYSKPVNKSEIPDNIWNADKLEKALEKMDSSIKNKDYNLTVSYAYFCLEGLYKAFINEKIPQKKHLDKINQLSVSVRDYIKEYFQKEKIEYPDQVINLIPTITNAISSARNSFSDSHFDGDSEKYLAEFARDCVNSIGRLIINFIK